MDELEKMVDVVEETNNIMRSVKPNNGLKIGIIGIATIGVGLITYRYVVKPIIAKIKSRRNVDDSIIEETTNQGYVGYESEDEN